MCGKTRRRAKDYAESFFDPRSKPYGRLKGKVKKASQSQQARGTRCKMFTFTIFAHLF